MMRILKKCDSGILYALFGNCAIVAFIVMQACDGAFTYVAVQRFGLEAEWNPIVAQWVIMVGDKWALIGAKVFATTLGIVLHVVAQAHFAVAALAMFYLGAAVWPWMKIFLFES